MGARRKFSALIKEFRNETRRLSRLDRDSQARFDRNMQRQWSGERQLHILTESILFSAYRNFENLVHDAFILYCLGRRNNTGKSAIPYLRPRSFGHGEELIQSTMRHLDWTDPDMVIRRSELYLKNGEPVKGVFTSNKQILDELRILRNHIAHNSKQSRRAYVNLLQQKLGTIPLRQPPVGEFLLMQDREEPAKYYLETYLETLGQISEILTG